MCWNCIEPEQRYTRRPVTSVAAIIVIRLRYLEYIMSLLMLFLVPPRYRTSVHSSCFRLVVKSIVLTTSPSRFELRRMASSTSFGRDGTPGKMRSTYTTVVTDRRRMRVASRKRLLRKRELERLDGKCSIQCFRYPLGFMYYHAISSPEVYH